MPIDAAHPLNTTAMVLNASLCTYAEADDCAWRLANAVVVFGIGRGNRITGLLTIQRSCAHDEQ